MATLRITRGDSERLKAVITPYTAAAGLRFMAKRRLGDADSAAIINKSIGNGIFITVEGGAGVSAEAQIIINPADTQTLPNKRTPVVELFYDLVDGDQHTLDTGKIIVEPEVLLSLADVTLALSGVEATTSVGSVSV